MALPYTSFGQVTGSLSSGSYLSTQDMSLFYVSQSRDVWFGFSPNDVLELSVYDTENNFVSWSVVDQQRNFKDVTLTYINELDTTVTYTYKELIRDFILYKNDKYLAGVTEDLLLENTTDGTNKLSYVFTRNLAGSHVSPLSIKEISPSRKEVKLIPKGGNTISYTAFCLKKFPIGDVAPVLISATQQCPYDQIYRLIKPKYVQAINWLQTIFFLTDDGSVLTFLRNLYEDYIKYTSLSSTQITSGLEPTKIFRIQGIRTYFSNYLLERYNGVSDFDSIEQVFGSIVNKRLDIRFGPYANQQGEDYKAARQFCYDFFFTYFYEATIHRFQNLHQDKYYSYLKNSLNFGNNRYSTIIDHDYWDERTDATDPFTLVVKLASELPSDISEKDNCWVSNLSMVPYVVNAVILNPVKYKTIRISSANFGSPSLFVSKQNSNKLYSSDDLTMNTTTEDQITTNRTEAILNTDYGSFSNFIVFSSAANRVNIFKTKATKWYTLNITLATLDARYNLSLSSSVTYPYYTSERNSIVSQMTDLVDSFDGYESYLFNSDNFVYIPQSSSFADSVYVADYDSLSEEYDRNNKDSLINNIPGFIYKDTDSEDYLTFLNMVGHHFDNIYTYVAAMPIARQIHNQMSSSLPLQTLQELLGSFGWSVDDIIGSLNIDDVYLNSLDASTYNAISAEERLKIIWNRILNTLPGLYKTKGTEECVRYLLSCYGIPTELLTVREFGGTDWSEDVEPTYKLDEKLYMMRFSGPSDYVEGPIPFSVMTVEFKFAVESSSFYSNFSVHPLFTVIPSPYTTVDSHSWYIGVQKVPGQFMGQVIFQMGSGSTGARLTSSIMPIFNGDPFSVLVRRNDPYSVFEDTTTEDAPPLKYDLTVQRSDNGIVLFQSTNSVILETQDNMVFSNYGKFRLGNGGLLAPNYFIGTLDKLNIWDIPLSDLDFDEHVNDFNAYSYSGSNANQHLWVRVASDFPVSLYDTISGSPAVWVDNRSSYYAIPNYFSSGSTSSSINLTLYSASYNLSDGTSSFDIFHSRWLSYYPSGSVDIYAQNFPQILDPNWSASFNGCLWVTHSVFPYNFRAYSFQQDIDASKWGPNRYRNKKIRKIDQSVESRFDARERSTFETDTSLSGESNQVGFFVDPQDAKNKDILRYVGKAGIMEMISNPADLYNDRYALLKNKNVEYNSYGNKRTLFNELITIYKFYFDKSIFSAIKNVVPARSNILTGIVVEPTLLERPKYQHRPLTCSYQDIVYSATISGIATMSMEDKWSNFNTDWDAISASNPSMISSLPPSYTQIVDITYINDPVRQKPVNLLGNYYPDELDTIQRTRYSDYQAINAIDVNRNPILGTLTQNKLGNLVFTGSITQSTVPYLLKVWKRYDLFGRSGPYYHTDIPEENLYTSTSVWLYDYEIVNYDFRYSMSYFENNEPRGASDPSTNYFYPSYSHSMNTFVNTPNLIVSNVRATNIQPDFVTFNLELLPCFTYFELVGDYPRNHYTHKSTQFSKIKYPKYITSNSSSIFVKGRQTINSTISETGIDDGTFPVQTFNVSNVNVMNTNNVLEQ